MQWRTPGGLALLCVTALGGCNPYENFDGEFYAGTVDPAKFGKTYLGGGDPKMGGGMFAAASAFAGGKMVAYYNFPTTASDPTLLVDNSMQPFFSVPTAYVFDAMAPQTPFPAKSKCTAPAGYIFDLHRDPYRLDEQGAIFTELPGQSDANGNAYLPVVAEVPATSAGESCQAIKSEKTLLAATNVTVPKDAGANAIPDGNFLAWAIVDPSADFAGADPNTGFGPGEHWGWYKRFLLAYIDGGYFPTMSSADGKTIHAVPQKLFVADTMGPGSGMPGGGTDVLEHARGEAGYSPLCQVITYDPTKAPASPTKASDIPAAAIDPAMMPTYIYCLQVQP